MNESGKLSRSEWAKTPYAKSEARNPDAAILALLAKYGVVEVMNAQYRGPNGRLAFGVRFVLRGKPYRIALEVLNAEAKPEELCVQVKRAIYHYLKSLLEVTGLFISTEQALFAHLELSGEAGKSMTMWEYAEDTVKRLVAPSFAQLMLSPKPEE
jgi:hypothetical protein